MEKTSSCCSHTLPFGQSEQNYGKSRLRIVLIAHGLIVLFALTHGIPAAKANEPLSEQQIESVLNATGERVTFFEFEEIAKEPKIVQKFVQDLFGGTLIDGTAIALVDINNDGKDDVFYVISNARLCGSESGCPVGLVINEGDKKWRRLFEMESQRDISILTTKHLGYNDLRWDAGLSGNDYIVDRYDDKNYSPFLKRNVDSDKNGNVAIISTYIHDGRTGRWRFVDKK